MEQITNMEIIRDNSKSIGNFTAKKPSFKNFKNFKKQIKNIVKSFLCPDSNCNNIVSVYNKGPVTKNKKHRHIFILNQEN